MTPTDVITKTIHEYGDYGKFPEELRHKKVERTYWITRATKSLQEVQNAINVHQDPFPAHITTVEQSRILWAHFVVSRQRRAHSELDVNSDTGSSLCNNRNNNVTDHVRSEGLVM